MSEQTTNPVGESSLSLNDAADAIKALSQPRDSKEQPVQKEPVKSVSEGSTEEVVEAEVEDSQEQPEAEVDTTEPVDDDEFQFGEERVKASTLKEWRENGLRQQDYTKKTQELANARREWEDTRAKEEAQFRQQWQERITQFADVVIDELKPFEKVDWDALRAEDPYNYQIKWADFQRAQLKAVKAQEHIRTATQEEQKRIEAQRQQELQVELNEARKRIPDLADPVKAEALVGKMSGYLKDKGFSPEEIAGLSSGKALDVIHDAMRYRALVTKSSSVKDNKVVAVQKVVKPGTTQSNKEVRSERSVKREQALHKQLRSSGSLQDAAALLRQRIK